MRLVHIEIVGFRGINRLSLKASDLSAFLGENSWGKSSLFDALSLFLSGTRKLNKFTLDDFHIPPDHGEVMHQSIQLVFTFKEQVKGESFQRQYKSIQDAWTQMQDGFRFIYLQIEGEITARGNVKTRRYFLDAAGNEKRFNHDHLATLVSEFISFVPVLRMGQTSLLAENNEPIPANINSKRAQFERRIQKIFNRLTASSQQLSSEDLRQGYEATAYLFEHYLFKRHDGFNYYNVDFKQDISSQRPFSFEGISHFYDLLKTGNKKDRAMLLMILGEFIKVRGNHLLRRGASPILLLDEPETGLHPVNLAIT